MDFEPFQLSDFQQVELIRQKERPEALSAKVEALRRALAKFREFELNFFRHRLTRRPQMRGKNGLVFGPARWEGQHWYMFDVGGDQNEVQLNIGMFPKRIRVGLGFMIGRQVATKPPAFRLLQTFLGCRPPLPFRDALCKAVADHKLRIEIRGQVQPQTEPEQVVARLEMYLVPPNEKTVFVFLGHIWSPEEAQAKDASCFRSALASVMPFYEALRAFLWVPTRGAPSRGTLLPPSA